MLKEKRQQKIKKEQMTSFSGRLRPTWTNFLGTVVERPRCRWKHSKLNQIKTRKFSALSEPSKGRLAAREPWVCPGGGPNSSTGLGLGFQQTAPLRLLYPERVSNWPRVTQPVFILLKHLRGQNQQRQGSRASAWTQGLGRG